MTDGPIIAYRAAIAEGRITRDPAQGLAVEKLQSLYHALLNYRPAQGETGWWARFGFRKRNRTTHPGNSDVAPPTQGLYIFGGVGGGKSMLMDLFYDTVTVKEKRRVHFHAFMRDVHAQLHVWREQGEDGKDPLARLARKIADETWLLCFDELQVLDIADAMILARLFSELLALGVIVVATSNRAPDDLYKDGLQRERFLPFIRLIKEKLDVLELISARDYRLGRKHGMKVYHYPLDDESACELDKAFDRLTGGRTGKPDSVFCNGREIAVSRTADGVARFTFAELCARPLGAADYLALASIYHAVIISDIPCLGPHNRDQAKRFVTLIDALYEHKVMLVCSAEAPPEKLYPTGDGSFEFQRTVSRLMEMQSEDYLSLQHIT